MGLQLSVGEARMVGVSSSCLWLLAVHHIACSHFAGVEGTSRA